MTSKRITIEVGEGLTEADFQVQLESLSAAAHELMARALLIGKTCQHPDIAVLSQAAGFLEVAAHNGRAFRKLPADPDEPILPLPQDIKPKIQ